MDISIFKKLGFSDRSAKVYLALLQLGTSSVRSLALFCGLNRGTLYEALKWLQEQEVVSFYKKDSKQLFVAEDPEVLHTLIRRQEEELSLVDRQLEKVISELQAVHDRGGERPVARYFSKKEIAKILEDVLETCEKDEDRLYRIYSTEGLRECLYRDFSTFSDVRIAKNIRVNVIAIGGGGELRGLDERKWLSLKDTMPSTSILIYPGKTAYISLDAKQEPVGVVIENEGVSQTQKNIFDSLWMCL